MSRSEKHRRMLPAERRYRILNILEAEGFVKGAELAERFGVNIATIRRDLRALAETHGIDVKYGGASLVRDSAHPVLREPDLEEKQVTNLEAKRIIARKAAELVQDGESITLNAGSTASLILDFLPAHLSSITVVTLGLNIACRAARLPFVNLYLPGGYYRRVSQAMAGPAAERALEEIYVDRAFLGAVAVDMEAGWTHPAHMEVGVNRLLMSRAREKYLICDSSKFDQISFARVAGLEEFDAIISDDALPAHYVDWAGANGVSVL